MLSLALNSSFVRTVHRFLLRPQYVSQYSTHGRLCGTHIILSNPLFVIGFFMYFNPFIRLLIHSHDDVSGLGKKILKMCAFPARPFTADLRAIEAVSVFIAFN